jgi:hypothetical protein
LSDDTEVRSGILPRKLLRGGLERMRPDRRAGLLVELIEQPGTVQALALRTDKAVELAVGLLEALRERPEALGAVVDLVGPVGLVELLVDRASRDSEGERRLVEAVARIGFDAWERNGWHLTRNEFYSVIPDTVSLPDSLWTEQSQLVGIDMRDRAQVELLERIHSQWGPELDKLPLDPTGDDSYFVNNKAFESVDAEIYYSLIRSSKPATVLEIGAGWSTLLADQALAANQADGHEGRLIVIEPYPHDFLSALARRSERVDLRVAPLQSFPTALFEQLGEGDILFIDSSHVCKVGSDVQYEILELLPRLLPGVLVHIHDIFLPGEYPRDWVMGSEHRFWNEQYLLQAFLAFNSGFEVVWGSAWMHARHPDLLERAIASYDPATHFPGSFWLRRVDG